MRLFHKKMDLIRLTISNIYIYINYGNKVFKEIQ